MAEPETIYRVMQVLKEVDGMAYVHAEANHLVERDQRRAQRTGCLDAAGHADTRSERAELSAVREILASAHSLKAPVYFVHQSTPEAIDEVRRARDQGLIAYTESCPHYLCLNADQYAGDSPELFVCCPPLRSQQTVTAVTERALTRRIDSLGSDHCCYDRSQKSMQRSDVRLMPNGMPGVETRLPAIFTELVERRGLPLERFVAMTSANPARLNGIYPQKGIIAPGADADLILIDPREHRTVDAAQLHMATDYSPYDGATLSGWASTVIVAGQVVIDEGKMTGELLRPGRALTSAPLPQDHLAC
jgi:dihydropyrimidinase